MWQRFTEKARLSVFYSQEEAGRLGLNYVSTEHMLLGILRQRDSMGFWLITQMGIDVDKVEVQIRQEAIPGNGRLGQDMQLTPLAKRAIDLAYDEARQLPRDNFIGTEHLLMGIVREEKGLGGRVLRSLGVTLSGSRATLSAARHRTSAEVAATLVDVDTETATWPPAPSITRPIVPGLSIDAGPGSLRMAARLLLLIRTFYLCYIFLIIIPSVAHFGSFSGVALLWANRGICLALEALGVFGLTFAIHASRSRLNIGGTIVNTLGMMALVVVTYFLVTG